jgi:excisionase family DNA binding protein
MQQRLLTVKEVSQYLGLDPQTVYLWIKKGKIAALRPSARMVRISENELKRIMEGIM